MSNFLNTVASIGSWIWAYPLLILIVICGLVYTFRLGFMQIRHFPYIMKQTFGNMFKKGEGEGTVSPFQAAATALACTVGASNIVGVPIAIAFGGPGGLFWMWVCSFMGMIIKFAEIVLGIKYREKNEEGVYVSGPMYYMSKGFPNKKAGKVMAWMMSFTMLIFMPFTIAAQSVSAVQSAETIGIDAMVTGIVLTVLIGIITFGGIKRIASVTDKMVPIMVVLYVTGALIVIAVNISALPGVLASVFTSAFTGHAATGGFAGAAVSAAIRYGFARGAYSTDLGMGSAAMGHAAATTDHPVRQGFWGVFEVTVSGLVICTMSGLTILCTGVWDDISAEQSAQMPTLAFQSVFGTEIGGIVVSVALLFFVVSTLIVQVYYGERQCEFFFGTKIAKIGKLICVLAILMGAVLNLSTIFSFLDLVLGIALFPHLIALIVMSGQVVALKNEFFSDPRYYLRDKGGEK